MLTVSYQLCDTQWNIIAANRQQHVVLSVFLSQKQELLPFGICSHKLKENYEIHLWLEAPSAYFKKSVVLAFLQTWEIIPDLLQKELRHINMTVNHIKKTLPASLAFGLHKNHIWQSALMATDDKKNYSLQAKFFIFTYAKSSSTKTAANVWTLGTSLCFPFM